MHTIVLHGDLKEFGDCFKFDVQTPHELIKALTSQIKGIGKRIKDGQFRLIRGKDVENGFEYDNTIENGRYIALDFTLGKEDQTLHLIPVLAGAKSGGIGKIIVGTVLIAASVVAAPFTGGTSIMAGISQFSFGVGGSFLASFGGAMLFTGLSSILQPAAKPQSFERADEKPSYFISGPMNMAAEGGALAVAVGEFIVGSVVINASLEAVDVI